MKHESQRRADECRRRAEEARRRAATMRDYSARQMMLQAAALWDQMAEREVSQSLPQGISPAATVGCQPATNAEDLRAMTDPSTLGSRSPAKTRTLGDVLYAESQGPVSEQDWVKLVQSIAASDQLALHALYEMAHRVVFTLIMRITANRETAEELTIDVFHDVWRRSSSYDPANGTVLGWIMNQARSRALDRLRFEGRKKRRPDGKVDGRDEVAADPRNVLEQREEAAALRAALAALTLAERQAIETTFFGGLTHAEAAARLEQPLGTVKTRIRSGLHKLRQALTPEAGKS